MTLQDLSTDYVGTKGRLFRLALKTSLLTVLTLGVYRFWMKTRLRRYYWSAIRPGGLPLEYTGTGTEKLMGFLMAVVFLAFYIGIVNLILMFLSYALLNDNFTAYALSFVGLIPIYFFARYRARRYILARTRWRGVRFGIDPGAWGYSWRAMLHWLATILSLGYLLPRQMFWLEKYRTDRTWFGRDRFHQNAGWRVLLRPAAHYHFGLTLCLFSVVAGMFDGAAFALMIVALPWLFIGWVHLQVQAFRVLTQHKTLGQDLTFVARPSTWKIVRIYVFGGLQAYFTLIFLVGVLAAVLFGVLAGINPALFSDRNIDALFEGGGAAGGGWLIGAGAVTYFSFFIAWGVLLQVFITLPSMRHYAQTLTVRNSHHLTGIDQRPRDEFAEAEGFADALDIGAAI